MPISEQTQSVIAYFDTYSGFTLRKKNDLSEILDIAATSGDAENFNATVFTGKIVWNLYSQLRKITSGDTAYANIEQEFANAVNALREYVLLFANLSEDAAVKQRFQEVYLDVNQGTMRNLVDFAHDLARFKDMQSDAQRRSTQT
ncbi:MAG: hypothetical protein ACOVSW_19995 [Candidatus Kapaibacteriota bacterium]|jgi:hypothetical protein